MKRHSPLATRHLSLTVRAPWVVAFAFGLMLGLGFASGLSEAGLPVAHIPTALFFFSIGVETGHFLFIGVVLTLIALARRVKLPAPHWAQLLPPYAIGSVAMFWVIQPQEGVTGQRGCVRQAERSRALGTLGSLHES